MYPSSYQSFDAESIEHTACSLPVDLKHRDTCVYVINSKRSQNIVNVLYKTYASVKCTLRSQTLYNLMLSYTNRNKGDQRR